MASKPVKNHAARGRRRIGEPPPYLLHQATGRGYSTLHGRRHYFGPYQDQSSREAYERFRLQWLAQNGPTLVEAKPGEPLADILPRYLREVEPAISPKEFSDVKRTLTGLVDRFGDLWPDAFRSMQFKSLRQEWIGAGNHKGTIAKKTDRVRRWFRWMVENELCSIETQGVLLAIGPAPNLPENDDVEPVPIHDYVRTIRRVTPQVRAIARVQLLGGPRPGETCRMRGCEITQKGMVRIGHRSFRLPEGVWLFRPTKVDGLPDKKKGTNKTTIYLFGPKAQAVLRPWMRSNPSEYLFQPREAQAAARKVRKKTPSQEARDWTRRKGNPRYRDHYAVFSYRQAITRAAARAGVPHWFPHQLRHTFTTRMDTLTDDLLTVSTLLSHERPDTTLIYLQRKLREAAKTAARLG